MENAEWITSTIGERRRGTASIDLTSGPGSETEVTFLERHLPSNDETASELWALGVTGTSSSTLSRKDTAWHTVTVADAMDLSSGTQFHIEGQTLHGKLFLCYNSAVDNLHVWDGTSLRRAGLPQPSAAPTAANNGSGSFVGVRYYRVRWAILSGSTVLLRSEPSATLTFTPSTSGSGVVVTLPTVTGNESATHWELEAATDNANFYRIATTVVGTTTVTDTAGYVAGYTTGVLSETIGDYLRPGSFRFVIADQDRLLMGGSWETAALQSRIAWTPVYNDPGVGNDERVPLSTDNTLDLDGFEGGPLTGISNTVNGYIYCFKLNHTYRLVRTGALAKAYDAICLTKQRGAVLGSIVDGIDQAGRPCVYYLDPTVGPCRIGFNGPQMCGADILTTWRTININASQVIAKGVYYPESRQVMWWIATNGANSPNLRIVLQTNEMQDTIQGTRRGWSMWTGASAAAKAVCLYAKNIDTANPRSLTLSPVIAFASAAQRIHLTDTGNDDSGAAYTATITSKPYIPASIMSQFGVLAGALFAKAANAITVLITVIRDFGLETKTIEPINLTPEASEVHVIKQLDDLTFSECYSLQFQFTDVATASLASGRWEINQLVVKLAGGQS